MHCAMPFEFVRDAPFKDHLNHSYTLVHAHENVHAVAVLCNRAAEFPSPAT